MARREAWITDPYAGAVVHRDEDRHLALPEGGGGGGVGAPHHIQRLGADGPRCGGGAAGVAAADGRVGKPTALDGYEGAVESVQRVLGDAFASACGFEVDACRPGRGLDRGKVDRGVRGFRESKSGVFREGAGSLGEFEERLAARGEELMARWICPANGESVAGALAEERRSLRSLPTMVESSVRPGLAGASRFLEAQRRTVEKGRRMQFRPREFGTPSVRAACTDLPPASGCST